MAPGFKNVGERSRAKNYTTVSLLSVVSKVFEKLVNNKHGLLSDFQVFLDFLDQLQILWQLYLIDLVGLLTDLGT